MKRKRQRRYWVAQGAGCIICTPHDWKAFREPEERDCMSPCTRDPIYEVMATSKREAVAIAKTRCATEKEGGVCHESRMHQLR